MTALKQPKQSLLLWDGEIESSFRADGETVEVSTGVHPQKDALFARIKSNLLKNQRAAISLRFSYPTGKHADDANDWSKPEKHQSVIIAQNDHSAVIERTLDATKYYVLLTWSGPATLQECDRHHFELTTTDDVLTFSAEYLPELMGKSPASPFAGGSQEPSSISHSVLTPEPRNWSVVWYCHNTSPRSIAPITCPLRRLV